MILVFDTETTGKVHFHLPAADRLQPHLVQLGAILVDEEFRVRGEINLIVKPDGWEVPDEAQSVHGISTELADKFGLRGYTVLDAFCGLADRATVFVAHNTDFDFLVMSAFSIRSSNTVNRFTHFRDTGFCTMKAMTPICKLLGAFGDYKWPKLQEAYRHAFNEEFEGAHDAMADVRACLRLYRWIKEQAAKEVECLNP